VATIAAAIPVRRDSQTVWRAIESAKPHVDAVVALYSGEPGDDTWRRLIKEGAWVSEREFDNAAAQRTALASVAKGTADYLLLMDDDNELVMDGEWPELTDDLYMMEQTDGEIAWRMPHVLNNRKEWRWGGGPAHEYIDCMPQSAPLLTCAKLMHYGDGRPAENKLAVARKQLEKQVKADPTDSRSLFYLAQTLREQGNMVEAGGDADKARDLWLEAARIYGERILLGGWDEEVWYAHYMQGVCMFNAGLIQDGKLTLLAAYMRRPWRTEPLHAICQGTLAPESDVLWIQPAAYAKAPA
jgi:tetratricopeptide (TPR) repeat protein